MSIDVGKNSSSTAKRLTNFLQGISKDFNPKINLLIASTTKICKY
jgi:hypothetical protein